MRTISRGGLYILLLLASGTWAHSGAAAGKPTEGKSQEAPPQSWQDRTVDYARIMSRLKWTPVAPGMPKRRGTFEEGVEYTGVPYSSVKWEGRYIGFDIFLKTFLAAVQNPKSVLYTENLYGKVQNAECYYGMVCSAYTSYGLQCGHWYVSRVHGPSHRSGVELVEPQFASHAQAGDIIFTPPTRVKKTSHIVLVTEITTGADGEVTHVRVEESTPPTTKSTNYDAGAFNAYLRARGRELYRITDLDAWREDNKSESFLFPNYKEDSATPLINRVLLLDRGDWVPYYRGQPVKFNVMDRDQQGVKALVIKRGESVVEMIEKPGIEIIERSFEACGDYTAHCVMNDNSHSQACEFSVCDLDFRLHEKEIAAGKLWEISISSQNMNVIMVYIRTGEVGNEQRNVIVSEEERKAGRITISGDVIPHPGKVEMWLIGENKYGRLKKRDELVVK